MAELINGKVKLQNGQLVTPSTGGWYDGQQFWNGTLSAPGVINSQSNQQGAGQAVSKEITDTQGNTAFIAEQQKKYTAAGGVIPGVSNATPTTTTGNTELDTAKKAITDIQAEMDKITAAKDSENALIADNPLYSEGTMSGKINKTNTKYNADLARYQTQLTNATNNYDTLVKAATPETETIQSTNDAGETTAVVINKETGAIISSTNLGKIGKVTKNTATATEKEAEAVNQIKAAASAGESFSDIIATMSGSGLTPNQIYNLYNSTSKWGPVQLANDPKTAEDIANQKYTKAELQALGVTFASEGTPTAADELIKLKNAGVIKG
jgi:hypothetical protein